MEQERTRAFRYEGERAPRRDADEVEARLREAARLARSLGVALSLPDLAAHEVAVCEENPLRNLFVSAGGDVSPCVFAAPPLASPFRRIFRGEERVVERVVFGNVLREPFERIWERHEYVEFRERFLLRRKAFDGLYESLLRHAPPPREPLPPPPVQCASCHKLLGL
jgi:MoaA/NifB/PqqE/SkfB family radical SAM enzyme